MRDLYDSCTNARAAASAALDGELPELDAARLRRHLRGCADCADWIADVGEWQDLLWTEGMVEFRGVVSIPSPRESVARKVTATAVTRAAVAAEALALWDARRWAAADRVALVRA